MSIKYRIYKFAEFEMDEEEATLLKSSRDVELTATEFSILLALIRKRGKSISTANLFEEVWGLESAAQESNVPAHIKGIRNKFAEPDREKFIKTEKNKKGYKFHFEPVIEGACRFFCVNSIFGILPCPPKLPVIKNLAEVGISG